MNKWPACWRLILTLLVAVLWSGCVPTGNSPSDEEKDPNFIEGRNYQNAMDYKGAIEAFERAVRANPHSAAAHFELGLLYEKMGEYEDALYHYRYHLKLRPKSEYLEAIKPRITTCKMEIAKTVTFGVVTSEVHRDMEKLKTDLALSKQQNDALRAQLAAKPMVLTQWMTLRVTNYVPQRIVVTNESTQTRPLTYAPVTNVAPRAQQNVVRSNTPPSRTSATQARVTPLPPQKKTYVVRSGETLAQVARKFNVTLARLQAANPSVEPKRIHPGQTLTIPSE